MGNGHKRDISLNSTINGDEMTMRGSEVESSVGTYGAPNLIVKQRDIEEEDYIYKVPCAARETISLRDSVHLTNNKFHLKGEATEPINRKDIQLTEFRSSAVETTRATDILSELKDTHNKNHN